MENLSTIIVLLILVVICVLAVILYRKKSKGGCCSCGSCASSCTSKKEVKTLVYINGMHCTHCSSTVQKAFEERGFNATVNLEEKVAEVYSIAPLDEKEIAEMINALGFTFVKME